MSWILDYERTTTGTDRLVLLSLANHATKAPIDGAWESYPGIDLIRQEANIAKRQTVKDALARLVERGIISKDVQGAPDRRIRADRRPNLYRIHGGPSDGSPHEDGGPSDVATGAPPRARGGPSQGPQTVIEPTAEPLDLVAEPLRGPDPVSAVFDAWRASTRRTAATVLDAKRRKLIENALRTYPVDEVIDAVTGWQHSGYHRGENAAHRPYNDLGLLLRDAEHIERFRMMSRLARRRAQPQMVNGAVMDVLL